jgi:hypothetical protein
MILQLLIAMVAGWLQRHQQQVITYLQTHVQGVRLNHTIFAGEESPTIVADCIPL